MPHLKPKRGIILFGIIEILIGFITLIAVILSLIQGNSTKPLEVLVFVLITAAISAILGFGILKYSRICYYSLLYFSSIIILSKILIFTKIITLSGALETTIPSFFKNLISILYHSLLIFYFTSKSVRENFI
jgi:hypothetical protein